MLGSEQLTGVLERIVYCNEENQYCIGELQVEQAKQPVTIVGTLPGVQCGETLTLKGEWTTHPQYGRQFKIATFESKLPSSVYGLKKYLGSGLVPGIGKVYAQKIVDHFGEETLMVISEESARLMQIPGIGKQRAQAIKKAWESQAALREVMLFLKTYGVGTAQCLRLVKHYGNEAKRVIQDNPYQVIRTIHGIGFKTADQIALNLGFASDSPERIAAGIMFAIEEHESEGHTCIQDIALLAKACTLLAVDSDKVKERFEALVQAKELITP